MRFPAEPRLARSILPAYLTSILLACGSEGTTQTLVCSAEDAQKLAALVETTTALEERVAALRATLGPACAAIAEASGQTGVPDASDPASMTDDDVTNACDLARQGLEGAQVSVSLGGGHCAVDHVAQIDCENEFGAGACGSFTVERCPDLLGECSSECTGSCTPAMGQAVACEGTCHGVCGGTCDGSCDGGGPGPCDGLCVGTCSGGCRGTCEAVALSATCNGWCAGSCSVELIVSSCTRALSPPPCSLDASCGQLCRARGLIGTDCDALPVVAAIADPALEEALEAHLPTVVAVTLIGKRVQEGAADLHEAHDPYITTEAPGRPPFPGCEGQIEGISRVLAAASSSLSWLAAAGGLADG
jgi:hypothetical protein